MAVDVEQFRAAMSRLPTGVTVLTTPAGDGFEVMTANAVTSVSLDPVLVLASVQTTSRWLRALTTAGRFAVNVLAAHHEDLARWCASRTRHERPEVLADHGVHLTPDGGALLIDEALFAVECDVHAQLPAGDHVLVLGEVSAVHVQDVSTAPLVFFNRAYGSVRSHQSHLHPVYPAVPEVPAAVASG